MTHSRAVNTANDVTAYVIVALAGFGLSMAGWAVWHELGHCIAVVLSGQRVTGLWGSSMSHTGPFTVFIAFSGYAGGILLPTAACFVIGRRSPLLTAWLSLKPLQEWLFELQWTQDQAFIYHRAPELATGLYAVGTIVGFLMVTATITFAVGVVFKRLKQ